jgi:hypothetical protein
LDVHGYLRKKAGLRAEVAVSTPGIVSVDISTLSVPLSKVFMIATGNAFAPVFQE